MNAITIVGWLIFLSSVIGYRVIMTSALARLDDAAKLRLIAVIPRRNLFASIILVVLVVAFFAVFLIFPPAWFYAFVVFIWAFLLFLIVFFISNYKKFQELSMPAQYLRSFMKGAALVVAATIITIGVMFYPIFHAIFYRSGIH